MRTIVIDRSKRSNASFYASRETFLKLDLIFRNELLDELDKMNLSINDKFNILCIDGSHLPKSKWNFYKNCQIVSRKDGDIIPIAKHANTQRSTTLFIHCEKIINNINEFEVVKMIRKEKLNNIKKEAVC